MSISVGEKVRTACRSILGNDDAAVHVDADACKALSQSITERDILRVSTAAGLPLRFDSHREKVNFLVISEALRFGHGWRKHQKENRSPEESITFGLIGLHISGTAVGKADFLSAFDSSVVEEFFAIAVTEDVRVESCPIATIAERGALADFADDIVKTMNSIGSSLRSRSCKDVYEAIEKGLSALIEEKKKKNDDDANANNDVRVTAGEFVELVSKLFPVAFGPDPVGADGALLETYRKAQRLALVLYRDIVSTDDCNIFAFERQSIADELTASPDDVTTAFLMKKGVISFAATDAGESLKEKIAKGSNIRGSNEEAQLCAATIVACDEIAAAWIKKNINDNDDNDGSNNSTDNKAREELSTSAAACVIDTWIRCEIDARGDDDQGSLSKEDKAEIESLRFVARGSTRRKLSCSLQRESNFGWDNFQN